MKSSIKHGGIVRCDMVHVDAEDNFKNECPVTFISYSVASLVRGQAKDAGWVRPNTGRVKWPGKPPCADAKKVDLCPTHAAFVMTDAEVKKFKEDAKAARKAERARARAERKDEKRAAKKAAHQTVPKKRKARAEATA